MSQPPPIPRRRASVEVAKVGGRAVSLSLVGLLSYVAGTAINKYIDLEDLIDTKAREAMQYHEAKRIKDAHSDAASSESIGAIERELKRIRRILERRRRR